MTHRESAPCAAPSGLAARPVIPANAGIHAPRGYFQSNDDEGEGWRLIYEPPGTAADLLGGSERLLATVSADGIPALRWYVTPQPALVLGVGQPRDDFDTAACQRAGLPMVRRSSGGTAVLTDDGLLNLDVVLPAAHRLGHRDVVRAYAWLGTALTRALRRLGWTARAVAPEAARRDAAALRAAEYPGVTVLQRTCFGGRSPYEVLVAGRKVVGLCQVRRRAGTLYQAGILLGFDAERLAGLLSVSPAERAAGAARLGRRAGGLYTLPRAQPEPLTHQDSAAPMQRMLGGLAPAYRDLAREVIRSVERAIAETALDSGSRPE